MSEQSKGVAVVTGASSGIGAVYADRLARRGYDLVLTARRADRLKSLADKLSSETGRKVEVVVADLSRRADVNRIEDILKTDARVALLVNNAGVAAVTPLLGSNVDEMSDMIALNIDALVRLSYAAAPKFVERGHGAIVNIASAVSVKPELLNGVYGASKAFVLAFSQSLKHELSDRGVYIQAVLPGATATEIWDNTGFPVTNLPKEMVMTTEDMVDAALVGFDRREFITSPSLRDPAQWDAYERARKVLGEGLSMSSPAPRYGIARAA
jgi:short-subunit dehydrogenase